MIVIGAKVNEVRGICCLLVVLQPGSTLKCWSCWWRKDVILGWAPVLARHLLTVLLVATSYPTLHFLDSKGAPMHAIDNRRNTPGDLANREGHSECVIFLLNLFRLRLRLRLHVLTGLRTAVFSPVLLPPRATT